MNSPLAHDDKGRRVEKLEVEDDEERLTRIHNTLNKLSSSDPSSTITPPGLPKFDFGNRTTYEVSPNSELLARLQSFLPQLEASNALLETQDPQTFNIELPTQDERYIEMNLGLGVFESKTQSNPTSTTSSDADAEMDIEEDSTSSSSSSSSSAEGESETSSRESSTVSAEDVVNVPLSMFVRDLNKEQYDDSDSDEESEDELEIINTAFVPLPRRIKPLPRRTSSRSSTGGGGAGKGVGIVVLGAEEGARK
ncbi:hypothetical protein BDQ17DRAFT_1378582 [Cyathus striatus]|nr:hypothetical protein BDQ17DRAFT_1378582 [Cyathus striatus]